MHQKSGISGRTMGSRVEAQKQAGLGLVVDPRNGKSMK
jgi:hypothetical protein